MKQIKCSDSTYALVNDADYRMLSLHKWHINKSSNGISYAKTTLYFGGARKYVAMHRVIMDLHDENLFVDHKNHNTLDNRRKNLRICTRSQNQFNKRKKTNGVYEFKGICKGKNGMPFSAKITCDGVVYKLGYFKTQEAAAKAYDKKAKELFGEFAYLNSPTQKKKKNPIL